MNYFEFKKNVMDNNHSFSNEIRNRVTCRPFGCGLHSYCDDDYRHEDCHKEAGSGDSEFGGCFTLVYPGTVPFGGRIVWTFRGRNCNDHHCGTYALALSGTSRIFGCHSGYRWRVGCTNLDGVSPFNTRFFWRLVSYRIFIRQHRQPCGCGKIS